MHVARPGPACAVDDSVPLDHADGKAGQVEVAPAVDVGHLGRLAAEQGAVRLSRQPSATPSTIWATQSGSSLRQAT